MKDIFLYYLSFLFLKIDRKKVAHRVAKRKLKKAKCLLDEISRTAKILAGLKFLGAYFRIPDVTRKLKRQEAGLRVITEKCELWAKRAEI